MFDRKKATELAAFILSLDPLRKMNFVKLLKLIYLADREALDTEGHSISTDTWASMKHGPVPICTYNLVGGGGDPDNAVWDEFIEDGSNYMVHLRKHPGMVYLSESEQSVVKKVFDKYGGLPVWVGRAEYE